MNHSDRPALPDASSNTLIRSDQSQASRESQCHNITTSQHHNSFSPLSSFLHPLLSCPHFQSHGFSYAHTHNSRSTHRLSRPPTLIPTDLLDSPLKFRQIQSFTAQFDACVGEDSADFGQFVGIASNKFEPRRAMGRGGGGGHGGWCLEMCWGSGNGGGEKGNGEVMWRNCGVCSHVCSINYHSIARV